MTDRSSRLRTLLLSLVYPHQASYYDDWSDAFRRSRDFDCTYANVVGLRTDRLAHLIHEHDAIVLLHSTNADTLDYLAPIVPTLSERKSARLLTFVGNEYNSPHASLSDKIAMICAMRPDIVATQLLQEAGDYLYAGTCVRVISLPHALNSHVYKPGPASAARRLDIGFRGYHYPTYIGDDARNQAVAKITEHAQALGLSLDFSESQRLGRKQWAAFLADCRATVATEAGSWYLSRSEDLVNQVAAYAAENRTGPMIGADSPLRNIVRGLPLPVKSVLAFLARNGPVKYAPFADEDVPFATVYERFFKDAERCPVYSKAVSSRHFDAIGSKTALLMPEGRYNDILTADEHYICIAADMSNVDDALAKFADASTRESITESAYEIVQASHTHAHRIKTAYEALTAT